MDDLEKIFFFEYDPKIKKTQYDALRFFHIFNMEIPAAFDNIFEFFNTIVIPEQKYEYNLWVEDINMGCYDIMTFDLRAGTGEIIKLTMIPCYEEKRLVKYIGYIC